MNRFVNFPRCAPIRCIINRTIIFSFFLILLFACPIGASTYYVKNGGNDSANGTSGAPWATISKVASTVTSGDTVYFDNESTWSGTIPVLTVAAGVTYNGSSWGSATGRAKLIPTNSDNFKGVVLVPSNNVVIKGFEINGNNYITNGIDACSYCHVSVDNVTIDNCIIHHIGGTAAIGTSPQVWSNVGRGIYLGTMSSGYTISNVTIKNTTVYNINYSGIVIYPTWHDTVGTYRVDTVLVQNCTVYNTGLAGDGQGEGIYIKNDADNVTVEYCSLYDNSNGVHFETFDNAATGDIQNAVIRYNLIYKNANSGIDFTPRGYRIDADIYGNIIYNNGKGATSSGYGIYIPAYDFGGSTINIYNNTIAQLDMSAVDSYRGQALSVGMRGAPGTPTNLTLNFKNNIVYANKFPYEAVYEISPVTNHSYNLIYSGATTYAIRTGLDGNKTYTNAQVPNWETIGAQYSAPSFTGGALPSSFTGTYGTNMVPNKNYFQLQVGSPAINNGETLGSSYDGCINGAGLAKAITRPHGAAYDIGAYEYIDRLTPPTGIKFE